MIGGILNVVGIPGFLENLGDLYEASDAEGRTLIPFIGEWWDRLKDKTVGVSDLWECVLLGNNNPDILIDLGNRGSQSEKIKFGQLLSQIRDRHYQISPQLFVRVAYAGTAHRAHQWKLEPISVA